MPPKGSDKSNPKSPKAKDITNREYFSGEPADTSNYSLSSSPEIPRTPPQTSPKTSSQGSLVNISKVESDKEGEAKDKKGWKWKGKDEAGDVEDGEEMAGEEEEWVAAKRKKDGEEKKAVAARKKKAGPQGEGEGEGK
ncbi:hypothetical protein PMIN06_008823 [Paraphaeosphaeria minitans]